MFSPSVHIPLIQLETMSTTKWLVIASLALIVAIAVADHTPEQTRVELTGDGRYLITYTTDSTADVRKQNTKPPKAGALATNVYYGTSDKSLSQVARGNYTVFNHLKYTAYIHTVVLPVLPGNTRFYYQVGDKSFSGGVSKVFSFVTTPPRVWAVYGDYGVTNMDRSLQPLLDGAADGEFHGVLHVGDIAYDLHNAHGGRGDEFMNELEPIAANMPYMFAVGNHEKEGNFTHYNNRYIGHNYLGRNSGSNTNLWYSFNQPYVHFVSINTEVYEYFPDEGQQQRQLAWLRADLAKANKNRSQYPWVIMYGHKCDWQDGVKFGDFRQIAHEGGVDLYICGHQHNYQRLFPGFKKDVQEYDDPNRFVNPKFWVQMVVGSPGCQEKISGGLAPYKDSIAAYYLSYGYGMLEVRNSTHLYWKWKQTNKGSTANAMDAVAASMIDLQNSLDSSNNGEASIKDEMLIIQSQHGPRPPHK